MAETDFINHPCDKTGCGVLLDVTNLYANSRNHQFDPHVWLHQFQPHTIRQIHIVGYSEHAWVLYYSHDGDIQQELFALIREIIEYTAVDSIIIERDHNFPPISQLVAELQTLHRCFDGINGPDTHVST